MKSTHQTGNATSENKFWIYARKKEPAKVVKFDPDRLPLYALYGIRIQYSLTDRSWQVYDHVHATWINLEPGDWISEGPKKEHYPINAEVFRKTYYILP